MTDAFANRHPSERMREYALATLKKYFDDLNKPTVTLYQAYQFLIGKRFMFEPAEYTPESEGNMLVFGGRIITPAFIGHPDTSIDFALHVEGPLLEFKLVPYEEGGLKGVWEAQGRDRQGSVMRGPCGVLWFVS